MMSRRLGAVLAAFTVTYVIAALTYANVWVWLMVGKATSHTSYALYYGVYGVILVATVLATRDRDSVWLAVLGAVAGVASSVVAIEVVAASAVCWPCYISEWREWPSLLVRDVGLALILQGWSFGAVTAWLTHAFLMKDWRRVFHLAVVVAIVQAILIAANRGVHHIHFY